MGKETMAVVEKGVEWWSGMSAWFSFARATIRWRLVILDVSDEGELAAVW